MAQLYIAWQRLEGQDGHLVGRQLLEALYQAQVGGTLPEIGIAPGGKPYFKESPWFFSISHTQSHGFCAVCRCPVGIDAEELSRRVNPGLAQKILSPEEKAQYDLASDSNKALLTFWVLKEAQGKCRGTGIGFHPNHTNFMLTDSRVQEIDGALVAVITQEDDHAF